MNLFVLFGWEILRRKIHCNSWSRKSKHDTSFRANPSLKSSLRFLAFFNFPRSFRETRGVPSFQYTGSFCRDPRASIISWCFRGLKSPLSRFLRSFRVFKTWVSPRKLFLFHSNFYTLHFINQWTGKFPVLTWLLFLFLLLTLDVQIRFITEKSRKGKKKNIGEKSQRGEIEKWVKYCKRCQLFLLITLHWS